MNPNQQFQNQVTGTYKKQLQNMNPHGSALAQSVNQAQAYAPIQQYYQQQQNGIQDRYNTIQEGMQPANPNGWPGLLAGPSRIGQWAGNNIGQFAQSGAAGGAAKGLSQAAQNPQVQRGLFQIGQFLHQIGHPIAQQFNQMHGFNFGQPQQRQAIQGQMPPATADAISQQMRQKQNIPQQRPR